MIDTKPTVCNICGGTVVYTTNAKVYGKEYGSGYCYLCTNCHAYVGTHKPRPAEALGILSNDAMRSGRKYCHAISDILWYDKTLKLFVNRRRRTEIYLWLSTKIGMSAEDCHFGYMSLEQLRNTYRVFMKVDHFAFSASGYIKKVFYKDGSCERTKYTLGPLREKREIQKADNEAA